MVDWNEGLREQLELGEEIRGLTDLGRKGLSAPLASQKANISGQTSYKYILDIALLKGGGH